MENIKIKVPEGNDRNYLGGNVAYQIILYDDKGNKLYGNNDILVILSPTANCQIASIAGVQLFIERKDAKEFFKKIYQAVGKKLVLIDVKADNEDYKRAFEDKIDAIFEPERIIFKQFYRSTNNSKMLMYLLNIEDL